MWNERELNCTSCGFGGGVLDAGHGERATEYEMPATRKVCFVVMYTFAVVTLRAGQLWL